MALTSHPAPRPPAARAGTSTPARSDARRTTGASTVGGTGRYAVGTQPGFAQTSVAAPPGARLLSPVAFLTPSGLLMTLDGTCVTGVRDARISHLPHRPSDDYLASWVTDLNGKEIFWGTSGSPVVAQDGTTRFAGSN